MEKTIDPAIYLFGIKFDMTILVMSLLVVLLVFGFVFWASRKMELKPKGKQNVLEWIYEFVIVTIKPNLGQYTKNYSLFFFALFFFLVISNNIGLISKISTEDYNYWTSPTANFGVDFALSIIVALIVHVEGIRKHGVKSYFKGYLSPMPAMLPMNILEEFTNLFSLALRLFGNIYSGEVMTSLLLNLTHLNPIVGGVAALLLNVLWLGFSIMISCIQAYVFIILASTYISHKVNHEE